MKAIARIALTVLAFVLSSTLSAQNTIWNEFVDGDLPPGLRPLSLGDNLITGAVGDGGAFDNGQFTDSDSAEFGVPPGMVLDQFLVRTDSGDSYIAFALYGAAVGQGTLGFGLFNPSTTSTDLLRFGSAPGPQPAGGYSFYVGFGGSSGFKSYTLDIVITQVPEPSTVALLFAGSVVLTFSVRRFR